MNNNEENQTPVEYKDDIYNKKTISIPVKQKEIGIDIDKTIYDNILNSGSASQLDISALESFTNVSQNRNQLYDLIDVMMEDSNVSAVLETYAEDATEANDEGRIVWCESDDSNINKYITFLLDTINVDKNIYGWISSLCKYGDLYLRLYHESDIQDSLFDGTNTSNRQDLKEDINLKLYKNSDKFVHYLEAVANPAEIFELTKFNKTYAYIKTNVQNTNLSKDNTVKFNTYSFKKRDVDIFDATNFVHASLDDSISRNPEEVNIFITDDESETPLTYRVKRGQSLFYNVHKIWRELMLLENSLLLNRLTKSSILRIINVEVGDMPKESVGPHLMGIKNLIEQKSAINTGNNFSEYTNPGPAENNIYVPTHNSIGSISMQNIGGDVNVTGLNDIDYFKNRYYGALRIPKQFFGDTDDATGFNGGTSLSIISSRYAKMIKRIQNSMIQALTDAINIMLIDKGLDNYINKFALKMLPPTTQEDIDRRENMSNKLNIVTDIMNLLGDIEDSSAKLKILKSLMGNIVSDSDIFEILEEQIQEEEEKEELGIDTTEDNIITDSDKVPFSNMQDNLPNGINTNIESEEPEEQIDTENTEGETILPTPSELNVGDFSDNENPALQ